MNKLITVIEYGYVMYIFKIKILRLINHVCARSKSVVIIFVKVIGKYLLKLWWYYETFVSYHLITKSSLLWSIDQNKQTVQISYRQSFIIHTHLRMILDNWENYFHFCSHTFLCCLKSYIFCYRKGSIWAFLVMNFFN